LGLGTYISEIVKNYSLVGPIKSKAGFNSYYGLLVSTIVLKMAI